MTDTLITLAEIGEMLHRKPRAVRQMLAQLPEIRPLRVGRSLMFTKADRDRLIEALRIAPSPTPRKSHSIKATSQRAGSRIATPNPSPREIVLALTSRQPRKIVRGALIQPIKSTS
jgi:hypothetical protein